MTISITKEFEVSAGHTLFGHPGKCRHLHGHNYTIRLTVVPVDGRLNDQGMVVDFGDLKESFKAWLDRWLDHRFLVNQDDPRADVLQSIDSQVLVLAFNPTAEEIARWILANYDAPPECRITRLDVQETGTSYASIQRP